MNISKIEKLKNQAIKEAQIEIDKIFKKYSSMINEEIALQIPKGQTLLSGNGICVITNKKMEELRSGSAWSKFKAYDKSMDFLAELQYSTNISELSGTINIKHSIAGKKDI